ncbi:MAG: glycosyltransferase, partial [Christensenellaceae bacterium]|nr:glycosyltransferase [Christensenellaceae bacterium]
MYVLIPAYKPDNCLLDIVREIHENTDYSIIVVNDGSGQAYEPVFAALPDYCTLLVHDVNKGKGRAMKTGFTYLCEHGTKGDGVVIVDADGQHLLKDVVRVCEEFAA